MELIKITSLLLLALARACALDGPLGTEYGTFKFGISQATKALESIDDSGENAPGLSYVVVAFQLTQRILAKDTTDIQAVNDAGFFEFLTQLLHHPLDKLRTNTCLFLRTVLTETEDDEERKKFKQDLADKMFEKGIVADLIELVSSSSGEEKEMATYSMIDIVYLVSDYHVPKLVHDGANDVVCHAVRTVDDEAGGADLMVKVLETAKKLDYREVAARKLESYARGGGGLDMVETAQMNQLAEMMGGLGQAFGGMGMEMPKLPGPGEAPHELSIHAQLCEGTENFCKIFPCGDQKQLGSPEDAAALKEAVEKARAEERERCGAQLDEMRGMHAEAIAELRDEWKSARDEAIKKAVEEARREERETCHA